MVITSHGGTSIKASAGDTTLVFGPVSKQSKNLKPANFGADVALISLNHFDMNGAAETARAGNEPFVIEGPGEYEIGGVAVHGFETRSEYGGEERINTIYLVHFDGMVVLYLGALADAKLPNTILEDIDQVDILFVPIGNEGTLNAMEAHKLAVSLEARAVIPIGWDGIGEKDALKTFLKETSAESTKPSEKLTVKPKDIAVMSGEVVVLKS